MGRCPSIAEISRYLETPVCGWALIAFRVIFGILLAADAVIERGWGEQLVYEQLEDIAAERKCSFPLFDWMPQLSPELFALAGAVQVFAALCISLGFLFRLSSLVFLFTFVTSLLADKLHWNNHSYLYCIMATLLMFTDANKRFSLDDIFFKYRIRDNVGNGIFKVPYWNYLLPQFQVALVYTYAGINKINDDWLQGRPLPGITQHWVFTSAKNFLPDIFDSHWFDFIFVRLGGCLVDSLSGIGLFFSSTRIVSLIFTTAFHVMNSQMFNIGVFSGVMLATQALFLPSYTLPPPRSVPQTPAPRKKQQKSSNTTDKPASPRYFLVGSIGLYMVLQILIPNCHFLFPGYITWTKTGQYGFSWEMMLHDWNVAQITVNLRDKVTGEDLYLDADRLVPMGSHRWVFHPDMIWQFSKCVEKMITQGDDISPEEVPERFGLYLDAWISLNLRVHQRFIDPKQDFFKASFSAFEKTPWVLPLIESLPYLNGYSNVELIDSLGLNEMISADNKSKVEYLVFADFPSNSLHHFIDPTLGHVQLFVLNGSVAVKFDNPKYKPVNLKSSDEPFSVPKGEFHTLTTTSKFPSLCVYTFVNSTMWDEIESLEQENPSTEVETYWHSVIKTVPLRVGRIFEKAKKGIMFADKAFWSLTSGSVSA